MVEDMCFKKYKQSEFLKRESQIVGALECEIDAPHVLEFLLLYFKLIRLYVQQTQGISKETSNYIKDSEEIAIAYCRITLVDIVLISVKPSIIAATAVIFGLFNASRTLNIVKKEKKCQID